MDGNPPKLHQREGVETDEFSADIIARISRRLVAYLEINYLKTYEEVNLNFTGGKFELSVLLSGTRTLTQLT